MHRSSTEENDGDGTVAEEGSISTVAVETGQSSRWQHTVPWCEPGSYAFSQKDAQMMTMIEMVCSRSSRVVVVAAPAAVVVVVVVAIEVDTSSSSSSTSSIRLVDRGCW